MATTIASSFSTFKSNLEITGLQEETVSTRQKNVRRVLDNGLNVSSSFITGSYSRSTMIAPLKEADVDIFVVLDPEYYKADGQGALLDKVKAVLKKSYTTPDISRNGQAVTITFSDFMVDVVPSFHRQGGGYLIPNTITKKWISTNPKDHITIMADANKTHKNSLKPIVKMIKCWNKNISFDFSNFHMEVLAYHIFNGVTISDFPSGVRYFFDHGRSLIRKKNPDPAGYNDDVGSYLNSEDKLNQAEKKFETAYSRAIKAEEYAARGNIEDAVNEWRKIFGNKFPSFG